MKRKTQEYKSPEGFYNTREAASVLNLSMTSIQTMCRQGILKSRRIFNKKQSPVLVYVDEIHALKQKRELKKNTKTEKKNNVSKNIDIENYLNSKQVAKILGICVHSAHKLFHQGYIKGLQHTPRGRLYYDKQSVEDFINKHLKNNVQTVKNSIVSNESSIEVDNQTQESIQITEQNESKAQNVLDFSDAKKICEFTGSYTNIIKAYPELIQRLRESIKAYKDFDAQDGLNGASAHKWLRLHGYIAENNTYFDFLLECIVDDIRELEFLMSYKKTNY